MPATSPLDSTTAAHRIAALAPQVGIDAAAAAVAAVDSVAARPQSTILARWVASIEAAQPGLGLSSGAAQFVLARAGLLSRGHLSLADHEAIRFAMMRKGPMPQPSTAIPGRSVALWPGRMQERGYVRQTSKRVPGYFVLICDSSLSTAAARSDFMVTKAAGTDFIPRRLAQPFGYVRLVEGSIIIFSRDELPLWEVSASGIVRQANPWDALPPSRECERVYVDRATGREWSSDKGQQWSLALLARYGIQELPLLVDVLPYLMDNDMMIEDAVEAMQGDMQPWGASRAA